MVAKSVLTASASPPAGYETMTDEVAVREWLASFGGAIAQADYYKVLVDAGFDSLGNMIFTSDQLLDSIEGDKMKPGHALRIARDAEQMVQAMGHIGTTVPSEPDQSGAALSGVDARKIAGNPPTFPPGHGNMPPSREEVEGWISKMIPWARMWSPSIANGIIHRRDKDPDPATRVQSIMGIEEEEDVYLGAQLLAMLPDKPRMMIDNTTQDQSSGMQILDIILSNFYKLDNDYLIALQDKFAAQDPVQDPGKLTLRLVEWRNMKKSLINKKIAVTELTQLGSLKKMMHGLKPAEAAIEAAELIKDRALTSSEILRLLDNIASKHETKFPGSKAKPNPNPNPNQNTKQTSGFMAQQKSVGPCFRWELSKMSSCKLGDKCHFRHDPDRKNKDDPETVAMAKKIPCPHKECTLGDKCVFKHD